MKPKIRLTADTRMWGLTSTGKPRRLLLPTLHSESVWRGTNANPQTSSESENPLPRQLFWLSFLQRLRPIQQAFQPASAEGPYNACLLRPQTFLAGATARRPPLRPRNAATRLRTEAATQGQPRWSVL